jgi:hypothetical protein
LKVVTLPHWAERASRALAVDALPALLPEAAIAGPPGRVLQGVEKRAEIFHSEEKLALFRVPISAP